MKQRFTKHIWGTREYPYPLQDSKFDFSRQFLINNDDTVSSDIWQFGLMPACISYSGELIACWSIRVINLAGETSMPNIFLTFSALRWLTPKGTALSSKPESCRNNYLSTFSIQHAWIKHLSDEISSLLLAAAASAEFTPPSMLHYFVLLFVCRIYD